MAKGAPRQSYKAEIDASVKNPTPRSNKRANPPKRESAADKAADTPAELARDKQRGIVEGTAQDEAMDVPPQQRGGAIHPHHVTAASGIAHAILNAGRGGG